MQLISELEWVEWHDAKKFAPVQPGLYLCEWEHVEDPKGHWWAAGIYFNYFTGKRWLRGSRYAGDALDEVPKSGPSVKPNTYVNDRCLRLVRWSFVSEEWLKGDEPTNGSK